MMCSSRWDAGWSFAARVGCRRSANLRRGCSGDRPISAQEREKQSVTDDDGRFELAGFPPHEECTIEIVDEDRGLRGTAKVAEEPHAGASRVVELGDIKVRGTGTVTGTVLGDGKPLAGAQISLIFQIERDGRTDLESGTDRVVTDSAGRFRFETVEAGGASVRMPMSMASRARARCRTPLRRARNWKSRRSN